MTIAGTTSDQFAAVRQAFTQNIEQGEDLGAACAVSINGRLVVDLVGGFQGRKKEKPWTDKTVTGIYSSGKAVVSLLVAMAVDQGKLEYEQSVSHYWPEFGASGKGGITLAEVLSHQAGLCGFSEQIDPALWLDWDATCRALASMEPMWPPGTANGYHPQTFGFLAGEILRRVTGKSVGQLISETFATPYDLSIYCGLNDETLARASNMTKPTRLADLGEVNAFRKAAFLTRWSAPAGVSREEWAKAEIPASNIHADAASLARLMSVIACDGEFEGEALISKETLEKMSAEQIRCDDLVLPYNLSWACGMMRNINGVYGPVESTLGHSGFGGSCVFADPENRVSFAYVMNKMSHHLVGDPRPGRLIETVYSCL